MTRKILFFDFDDTLYSHVTKRVCPTTIAALKKLEEDGHTVIVATGRGREVLPMMEEALGAAPKTAIVLNGQVVLQGGVVVYQNHMKLDSIGQLAQAANQQGVAYGGYYWDGPVANRLDGRVRKVWADWGQPPPHICEAFEKHYTIYQGALYITREEEPLYADVLQDYVTNWPHECLVNLIPRAAGKSQAVRWCMAEYGFTAEDSYAFGDGFNDVDMIEAVGHGVAMGNATSQALKEKAEYVTAAAHEQGIYKALRHYGLV